MQLFDQIGDGTNYGNAISWNLNLCEIVYLKICIVNNLKFNMMNKKILLKRDDTHLATIFHLRICWMLFLCVCVCVRYWLTCLYVHRRTYSQMARYLIINVRNKLEIMVYFWCAYLVIFPLKYWFKSTKNRPVAIVSFVDTALLRVQL